MTAGDSETGSVADRLNWLFDVIARQDSATGAWRRYTNAEAARALAGSAGQIAGGMAVEHLRAGAAAHPEQLAALAQFFGVDPAFFGDDSAAVAQICDDLLTRALRECGVLSYLICRMSVPLAVQREQLRNALLRERAATGIRRTWHDDRRFTEPGHDNGTTGMTATPMNVAQLHTLCQSLLVDLELNPPFDPHELCQRLAAHRGRRIKIRATDLGATSGVGHLAPTREVDQILIERNAPEPQQALVIFHEVMHLVRDHLAVGETFTCGVEAATGAYADWREWEAEVGARVLARLARERSQPNHLPVAAGPAEHSIAGAFGFTHGHRTGHPLD